MVGGVKPSLDELPQIDVSAEGLPKTTLDKAHKQKLHMWYLVTRKVDRTFK